MLKARRRVRRPPSSGGTVSSHLPCELNGRIRFSMAGTFSPSGGWFARVLEMQGVVGGASESGTFAGQGSSLMSNDSEETNIGGGMGVERSSTSEFTGKISGRLCAWAVLLRGALSMANDAGLKDLRKRLFLLVRRPDPSTFKTYWS